MMNKLSIALTIAIAASLPLSAQAAKYKVVAVDNGGTIAGKVKFAGKDLDPKIFKITKDNEVCGTGDRQIDYVRVNKGHLMDVVVYLEKVKQGKDFDAAISQAVVDQKGCEFKPFLQVMKNKTKVDAINQDPVLHNIHTYALMRGDAKGPKKTLFNVSQPDQNTIAKSVKMPGKSPAMKVECDAHDFMHGFIFVARNPYYAVVGEDGSFKIDDVPPGKYTIKAWHGMLKNQKAKVTVDAGAAASVDFTFK